MAKIEVGRFSELMRRYLSMAGVVQVTEELAPEISSVFILESERPEWEFLKGSKLCTSQISVTSVAAVQATGRIRNPVGSGVMAIIDKLNFSVDGNAVVICYRLETAVDLGFIVATMCRDTRFPALNVSALIASQDNVGTAGDFFFHSHLLALTSLQLELPVVLLPGFAIDINCETNATSLRGNVHWIERRLGEMEVA